MGTDIFGFVRMRIRRRSEHNAHLRNVLKHTKKRIFFGTNTNVQRTSIRSSYHEALPLRRTRRLRLNSLPRRTVNNCRQIFSILFAHAPVLRYSFSACFTVPFSFCFKRSTRYVCTRRRSSSSENRFSFLLLICNRARNFHQS